jgi:hypothetical protein
LRAYIQTLTLLLAIVFLVPQTALSEDGTKPFQAGTWAATATGSVMNDVSNHSDISYVLSLGANRYFWDGISLGAEVSGWYVTQDGDDATGLGLALVPRWHFYRATDWSVYADGGLGVVWTNEDVPSGAKKQNFTEFIGLGFTRTIGESLMLMAGARYRHVSNNNDSDNPGLDNIEGYLGLMLPF